MAGRYHERSLRGSRKGKAGLAGARDSLLLRTAIGAPLPPAGALGLIPALSLLAGVLGTWRNL